ncbi:uncharacterized protein K02A2.6-like [Aedes albopictus]|uniref:Uncharacterized protein n=1 Tax=Aedes albopictus TaxID=7160 RepID=A0ABM1YUJ3_AEDAL
MANSYGFVDTVKRSVKKICSGGESLEDSLQTFLTVYRSTPTPDLGGQSPAERMLGRSMRTVAALLKPPERQQQSKKVERKGDVTNRQDSPRCYKQGDTVYAQVHQGNSWSWIPGRIIERVGKVNYNVLLNRNSRLIRSHINQLRNRVEVEEQPLHQDSPLTVFLDEFGLRQMPTTDSRNEGQIPAGVDVPMVPIDEVSSLPMPELVEPIPEQDELQNESEPESKDEEPRANPETPERPRRLLRLPSKLQGYWLF